MKKIIRPILASVIYTLAMALGWVINPHEYGSVDNVIFMIPLLAILATFSIFLVIKSSVPFISRKTKYPLAFWAFTGVIVYLLINNFLVYNDGKILGQVSKIGLLFISTILVGIAEEGMYRGYILNTIEKTSNTRKALLFSSILFGLLHSVNFLAGPGVTATVFQVLITTAIGYVFGVIYLGSGKNLMLVAILHGIYDFLVFNYSHLSNINNSERVNFSILLLLITWVIGLKTAKKYTGSKVA